MSSIIKTVETATRPEVGEAVHTAIATSEIAGHSAPAIRDEVVHRTIANLIENFFGGPDGKAAFLYGMSAGWSTSDPREKFDINNLPDHTPDVIRAAVMKEYPKYNAGWTIGVTAANRFVQLAAFLAAVATGYARSKGWI